MARKPFMQKKSNLNILNKNILCIDSAKVFICTT